MPRAIASRIRQARRLAGLTQVGLAARIGVSRSAVAQWERAGGACPSTTNVASAAIALNCALEWLTTGRGDIHPHFAAGSLSSNVTTDARYAQTLQELHLLEHFRSLQEGERRVLMQMLKGMRRRRKRSAD